MDLFDRGAAAAKRQDIKRLMATVIKHYVRSHVWLPIAQERSQKVERPLKYFTLTTPALYDVRVLERSGLIESTERGYPGVGFCELNDKDYAEISRRLRRCFWSYKGHFEDMVSNHPDFETTFGFDVINLDFILVPFPGQESPLEGTWGAIQKLLQVQRNKRMSFDLFITFRGKRDETNEEAIAQVAELLRKNLEDGRGVQEFENQVGHLDPFKLLQDDYVRFLCMGLPKLLVGDALDLGFEISRTDVFKYPRDGDHGPYEIVKFAFGLEVPDLSQSTFAQLPHSIRNYDEWVPQIFNEVTVDIARILEADPDLKGNLQRDLESLGLP